MNSQVVVMEELPTAPILTPGNTLDLPVRTASPIQEEATDDEHESLRLADISSLMEGDRRSTLGVEPRPDTPFLSDLDPMDSVLVKHAALWLLNHSELKDKFDADDVLEGLEIRKGGLWNKFFRGERKVKKKGNHRFFCLDDGTDGESRCVRCTLGAPHGEGWSGLVSGCHSKCGQNPNIPR
jgi:hypothetical protein